MSATRHLRVTHALQLFNACAQLFALGVEVRQLVLDRHERIAGRDQAQVEQLRDLYGRLNESVVLVGEQSEVVNDGLRSTVAQLQETLSELQALKCSTNGGESLRSVLDVGHRVAHSDLRSSQGGTEKDRAAAVSSPAAAPVTSCCEGCCR